MGVTVNSDDVVNEIGAVRADYKLAQYAKLNERKRNLATKKDFVYEKKKKRIIVITPSDLSSANFFFFSSFFFFSDFNNGYLLSYLQETNWQTKI